MNIDEVVLNFTPGTLVILNVVLGLIMFGIALDTSPDDFKVVFRHPKPFIIAILAQLLVLPAVTFGLTLVLPVTASMALGMILVACCPPGNISQVPVSYTHLDVYKRQVQAQLDAIAERLGDRFDTRVHIKLGAKKGQVTIDFATIADLKRILDAVSYTHLDVYKRQRSDRGRASRGHRDCRRPHRGAARICE